MVTLFIGCGDRAIDICYYSAYHRGLVLLFGFQQKRHLHYEIISLISTVILSYSCVIYFFQSLLHSLKDLISFFCSFIAISSHWDVIFRRERCFLLVHFLIPSTKSNTMYTEDLYKSFGLNKWKDKWMNGYKDLSLFKTPWSIWWKQAFDGIYYKIYYPIISCCTQWHF